MRLAGCGLMDGKRCWLKVGAHGLDGMWVECRATVISPALLRPAAADSACVTAVGAGGR
jgi:hypothetical protein